MHPVLFDLPFGISIKSYGLMIMLGFFAATWWAMYRARKVKADPDVILNIGFISIIAGIVGARLFHVVEFWQDFANQPSPIRAALDFTSGGLVFYGGFLLALACVLIYMWVKKHSMRLYFDILAPSVMMGLAFGRMGCFLYGCCWGAPAPNVPWAVTFPYGSPAYLQQWLDGQLTVPPELLVSVPGTSQSVPVSRENLGVSTEQIQKPRREYDRARAALEQATKNHVDPATIKNLQADVDAAKTQADGQLAKYYDLAYVYEKHGVAPGQAAELASHQHSLAVHPSQLYAIADASLIAVILHIVFLRRRRPGLVFGLLFVLYSIGRFLEETVRGDNARDIFLGQFALTISQAISVGMMAFAIVYLIVLYRLPASPLPAPVPVGAAAEETSAPR